MGFQIIFLKLRMHAGNFMRDNEMKYDRSVKAYTVLSTRPAEKFIPDIGKYHFNLINIPLTKLIRRNMDASQIDKIKKFDPDVIILTSSYGSEIFLHDLWDNINQRDRMFIAIGASTAEPLIKVGIKTCIPENKSTEGIIEFLKKKIPRELKIMILRSNKGNHALNEFLKTDNREFTEFVLYDILENMENREKLLKCLKTLEVKAILLTSSMEASIFFKILREDNFKIQNQTLIYAIGEPTKKTIINSGYTGNILTGNSSFKKILDDMNRNNSGEWI